MSDAAPRVPGYVVGERLGAGGFGEVFAARREVIEREVAIKILHARYSADAGAVARFVAEARAVNRISHPGIVEIFDFGQLDDGRHYCVMERIPGRTLRELLRERTRLPLDEAMPLLRGIAEAIDAAHAAGIAHRDIKPDNVFVLPTGAIKLIDFGLAKLTRADDAPVTQTGAVMGTPMYMSPEQCRGRAIDLRTDGYSFGVLAYHVLTGEPPFSGDTIELALHHVNDEPDPPSRRHAGLSRDVDRVILALLAKDPADRPTPLAAVVGAMAGEIALPRRRRRRSHVLGGASLLGIAGLAAAGVWWSAGDDTARATTFRARTVELRFDGLALPSGLSADGRHLYYQDGSGAWRVDLTTRALERATTAGDVTSATPTPDGNMVVSIGGDRQRVEMEPPAGGRRRTLIEQAGSGIASPDGRRVAALRVQPGRAEGSAALVVHELATGVTRELVRFDRKVVMSTPRWSPDGASILWIDSDHTRPETERLHVTRLDDGATRVIGAPVLSRATTVNSSDFVDSDHIAYCAAGDDHKAAAIRLRSLSSGREIDLHRLDDGVSTCEIVAVRDQIVASLSRSESSLAVFDFERVPAMVRFPAADAFPAEVSADGDVVYVYRHGSVHLGEHRRTELETLSLTGARTREMSCPDTIRVIRGSQELVHVAVDVSPGPRVVRFLTHGSCAVADQWTLPSTDAETHLGIPRCQGALCALAGTIRDELVVWSLAPGGMVREIGRVPKEIPAGRHDRAQVALASDGQNIAALAGEGAAVHVVPTAGGTMRRLAIGRVPQSVAPSRDPETFFVASIDVDGNPYAIARVGWDGALRVVWSSPSTYVGVVVASGTKDLVAAYTRPQSQDFLVLER